jgi:hypothetical protein
MAELATGAVSTLLGVIGNEALRLGRVRVDVQFIKEEMESISSFLANLASAGREHDEQVRTWMNQARILANDCNTCIDLYLYRGDPSLNLPSEGLCRYLGWAPWLLRKLYAQHRAAGQLSVLKERARDIGERRLRYGVEVKTPDRPSSSTQPLLEMTTADNEEEEEDDDHDDQHKGGTSSMTHMSMDDETYLKEKLHQWIGPVVRDATRSIPSVVILVPDTKDAKDADTLVSHARDVANTHLKQAIKGSAGEHHHDKVLPKNQIEWNIVVVDVPKVHYDYYGPLDEWDILYYIWHQLKQSQQQQREGTTPPTTNRMYKRNLFREKLGILEEIFNQSCMEIDPKFEEITRSIRSQVGSKEDVDFNEKTIPEKSLDQLLMRLIAQSTTATPSKEDQKKFAASYQKIIEETAKKLKAKIHGSSDQQIHGVSDQQVPDYEDILQEVFPEPTTAAATNGHTNTISTTSTPVEGQIIEIIEGVKEMLRDLKKLDNYSGGVSSEPAAQGSEADFGKSTEEKISHDKTEEKILEIKYKILAQLMIRGIVDKIQEQLGGNTKRILIILKTDDNKHVAVWEETMKILCRLGCNTIAGAMIVATKTTQHQNKEDFCYPRLEVLEYPLVGRYLDTILESTKEPLREEDSRQILLRSILYECEPDEFSMKLFVHTFHAKPKRSNEELRKLLNNLRATQNSSPDIAAKMFNFSYKDLPKGYRSCLLYLAIFPAETEVRVSTLVGRWVAEGLITTTDWSWSSSVKEALKCFVALINQGLLSPAAIGATGNVKSCRVNQPVHGFIDKIARKQRILEKRLSSRWARHFSIFSDVRLRSSQKVEDFLKNIPKSSQFSKIKVLDLEQCNCFKGNRRYLRDICSKILMLKYLSLRNTDANHLPKAINNLHELEVLDIRETEIPMHATRKILLRKLKRVLGGSRHTQFSSIHIPEKIDKMEGMEVLSNVQPRNHRDLDHIAGRFTLKKLGVVIRKESHLGALLVATKDLKRSLRSLTITLNMLTPPTDQWFKDKSTTEWDPKDSHLVSLSIMGSTQKKELLTWFSTIAIKVAKVTISGSFRQDDMNTLAVFPSLSCVRLRRIHDQTSHELVFVAGFKSLSTFIIEDTNIAKIIFEDRDASKRMKMVGLKELDEDGIAVPEKVEQDINKNGDQSAGGSNGAAVARCPSLWKGKSWLRRN